VDFAVFAGFDTAIMAAVRSVSSPALTNTMWLATVSGDARVMTTLTVLAVGLLWAWGRRRPAVVLAVLMAADPLVASVLKSVFDRARPSVAGMIIGLPSDAGFPSGHAMASFVFYGWLALVALSSGLSPRRKAVAGVGALTAVLLVGVSRVFVGVHWPSDVLAGWAFASVLVALGGCALALWRRARGPERVPAISSAMRRRLDALLAIAAAVAAGVLLLQTYADPLF
jgi:undecaprenyl-diphosphatase